MQLASYSEVSAGIFEVPTGGEARVRVVGEEGDLHVLNAGGALDQLAGVSSVPEVRFPLVAFPNLRSREVFPSGVVAVVGGRDAALIPDGVGPDINDGLRLLTSRLHEDRLGSAAFEDLLGELKSLIHIGDEASGPLSLSSRDLDDVLNEGCRHLVSHMRIGTAADIEVLETMGHSREASAGMISPRAKNLTGHQLGTLGRGGSHFVEIEIVEKIFDPEAAKRFGLLFEGQVVAQLHAGARELGRQVHTDCLARVQSNGFYQSIPGTNPRLAWAPLSSKEGDYSYLAIQAAENYGLSNRHVIAHLVREAFRRALPESFNPTLRLACDVNNNTVRVERWNGEICCVYRRGAATAFPPGHNGLPGAYRDLGAPVLIPGGLGNPSFLMVSADPIGDLTWASVPSGAGRAYSRAEAHRNFSGQDVRQELQSRGISVSMPTDRRLAEEAPAAYRDATASARHLQRAGIARMVAALRPRAVLKG